jgi:sugar lactone lactonase YvrE
MSRATITLVACSVVCAATLAGGAGAVTGTDVITTVAGIGTEGFGGDGGQATAAQLNAPLGAAVDRAGNLYISDWGNNRVRKVTPAGVITTVAGTGTKGFAGDGGQATAAQLNGPEGLVVDGAGNLYISDYGNHRVRMVTPAGVITTVAGTGTKGFAGDGGQATAAQLNGPISVAVDGAGNLLVADSSNSRVRKVTPAGVITTVAGTGVRGFSGDGGPAIAAQLDPAAIALDGAGNLYIAEFGNQRVRKVTSAGVITTVAGTGTKGFSGDGGQATTAQLSGPENVAVDGAGNLYIADYGNLRVRAVSPSGVITTIVGTGTAGSAGDGGPAAAAQLSGPENMAVDGAGNLYIPDGTSNRVRKVAAAPPAAPAAPEGEAEDSAVAIEVVAASAGRNRLGKRVVRLELFVQETVSATLTLVRRGTTLATKRFASVKEGARVLTVRIPAGTAGGRASLRFELADEAGNTMSGRRGVRIGRP